MWGKMKKKNEKKVSALRHRPTYKYITSRISGGAKQVTRGDKREQVLIKQKVRVKTENDRKKGRVHNYR